jgi:predicted Zn-ribbon and HTH transcriptional regulator
MFEKIKSLFKKKPSVEKEEEKLIGTPFVCHHCGNRFGVTDKMQFPISVPMIQCERYVQGIGVQCPKCHQDSIYG